MDAKGPGAPLALFGTQAGEVRTQVAESVAQTLPSGVGGGVDRPRP